MGSTDFVDPYIDPATGILRNLVGASSQAVLDGIEADLVFARSLELPDAGIEPTGGLTELCALHRHLFQDIYDWAGELRTVDIRKNTADAEYFLPVSMIARAAVFADDELIADGRLVGMTRTRVVDRLAHHYDQLNYIHPFREGNGRTQRAYWDRVCAAAGWRLVWDRVTGEANDEACRVATSSRDLEPLREMFDRIVERNR